MAQSRWPFLSQLHLADIWDQSIVDYICGPLAMYCFLHPKEMENAGSESEVLGKIQSFLSENFPERIDEQGITFMGLMENLKGNFADSLSHLQISTLDRKDQEVGYLKNIHQHLFKKQPGPLGVIQVGAYYAEVVGDANKWNRCDGHFLTILEVEPWSEDTEDFFRVKVWDPWNGGVHWVVIFEEKFRDFTAIDFEDMTRMKLNDFTNSPNGYEVLSPYLNVLAPHMDMYDHEIFFAQRMIYVLERSLY